MKKSLLIAMTAFVTAVSSAVDAADSWWSLDTTPTFSGASGEIVHTSVVTIDMTKAQLRILSVPFEAGGTPGSTELSLRGFAGALQKRRRYQGSAWVLVNGGFSSYQVDVPLGLLVVNGKVYSPLTKATLSKDKVKQLGGPANSDYSNYRWSGILCQNADGRWGIVAVGRYMPGSCTQALQAGPVPIEPVSIMGITPGEVKTEPYVRTVLCIVDDASMKIVVTLDKTNLLPMATWMNKAPSAGGLGCRSAVNLSGDTSTGVAINSPSQKTPTFIGEGSFPLPSALLFVSR